MSKSKTYLGIGDIHGCKEFVDVIPGFLDSVDGLLCTGDVGGYGPDSLHCYEKMMEFQKRLESQGKLCKIVQGNHEEGLVTALKYAGIPMKGIASSTAQAGFNLEAGQLFGHEVLKEDGSLDAKKIKEILVKNWDEELANGNRRVIRASYLADLERKLAEGVIEAITPNVEGFRKENIVQSSIEQSFKSRKARQNYIALHEREQQLQRAVNILQFIVNLKREEVFESDGEVVGVSHTFYRDDQPLYVVGPEQLAYMDKFYERINGSGHKMNRKAVISEKEVFKSRIFDNVDTWFFGHVHSSDEYLGTNEADGKRIVMLPSPFPRDGKGTRAPLTFYHTGRGRKNNVERVNLKYNHRETERKLKRDNPKFLKQIQDWRSVSR